jgi:hypothetical protein
MREKERGVRVNRLTSITIKNVPTLKFRSVDMMLIKIIVITNRQKGSWNGLALCRSSFFFCFFLLRVFSLIFKFVFLSREGRAFLTRWA